MAAAASCSSAAAAAGPGPGPGSCEWLLLRDGCLRCDADGLCSLCYHPALNAILAVTARGAIKVIDGTSGATLQASALGGERGAGSGAAAEQVSWRAGGASGRSGLGSGPACRRIAPAYSHPFFFFWPERPPCPGRWWSRRPRRCVRKDWTRHSVPWSSWHGGVWSWAGLGESQRFFPTRACGSVFPFFGAEILM